MKNMKRTIGILLAAIMVCGMTSAFTAADAAASATGGSEKGAVLAEEGSGYLYDTITIGMDYTGGFQTGVYPAECDAGCSLVFDLVFKINPNTKEVCSDILEDWYFEDETTLIMKMKDNIYFSNGEKATAEDLLYSYTSHVDRQSAYTAEYNIDYENSTCLDELTVSMKFTKFYSAFFSSYLIYLYDKSWCEEVGWDSTDWYSPIGSGAYTCTEYVPDDHMTFVARDDYWNKDADPVAVRQWIIKIYSDDATMTMDMEVGNLAFCSLGSTDYKRFLENGGSGYDVYSADAGVTINFDYGFLENDCWYDKNVRKAFAIGIPWEELAQVSLGASYKPATSMVTEASPEYTYIGSYEYDPETAKQLLAEAGYDESNPLTLHTIMMETPFYSSSCEAFQYYCSQLGVEFNYDLHDVSTAVMDWMTPGAGCDLGFYYDNFGSTQAMLVRTIDWANNPFGSTWTYIDDAHFGELYDKMAYATDDETRIETSKELQKYIYDEYLCVPYAELTYQMAYRTAIFTADQIKLACANKEYYNLANISFASAWS